MTDSFSILPIDELLKLILNQFDKHGSIFGISKDLFFSPKPDDKFRLNRFGKLLETPIGVAAGPQTQLTQNIVAAWLTGARFIELKTIQTLEELEVSKPCIDMQDEGYNCEWSQELKIHQSFGQYLDAWIIIHVLRDKFGWNTENDAGVIFNMSVGYDLKGILNENVQWFFSKMADASNELKEKVESIKSVYPNVVNLNLCPKLFIMFFSIVLILFSQQPVELVFYFYLLLLCIVYLLSIKTIQIFFDDLDLLHFLIYM